MNDNDEPSAELERDHDDAVRRARRNGLMIGAGLAAIALVYAIHIVRAIYAFFLP